jgi:hypothetical protein
MSRQPETTPRPGCADFGCWGVILPTSILFPPLTSIMARSINTAEDKRRQNPKPTWPVFSSQELKAMAILDTLRSVMLIQVITLLPHLSERSSHYAELMVALGLLEIAFIFNRTMHVARD